MYMYVCMHVCMLIVCMRTTSTHTPYTHTHTHTHTAYTSWTGTPTQYRAESIDDEKALGKHALTMDQLLLRVFIYISLCVCVCVCLIIASQLCLLDMYWIRLT